MVFFNKCRFLPDALFIYRKSLGCIDALLTIFQTNSWLIVLPMSGSKSFQTCHMEVCWVLFCSSDIPSKCSSWWRTDYKSMQNHSYQLGCVRKPADRPAVAASLNRDLARILDWCNRWCMLLNPNKLRQF